MRNSRTTLLGVTLVAAASLLGACGGSVGTTATATSPASQAPTGATGDGVTYTVAQYALPT